MNRCKTIAFIKIVCTSVPSKKNEENSRLFKTAWRPWFFTLNTALVSVFWCLYQMVFWEKRWANFSLIASDYISPASWELRGWVTTSDSLLCFLKHYWGCSAGGLSFYVRDEILSECNKLMKEYQEFKKIPAESWRDKQGHFSWQWTYCFIWSRCWTFLLEQPTRDVAKDRCEGVKLFIMLPSLLRSDGPNAGTTWKKI